MALFDKSSEGPVVPEAAEAPDVEQLQPIMDQVNNGPAARTTANQIIRQLLQRHYYHESH